MYFSGKIEVDPLKMTKIEVVKPDNFFKKVLHHVTFGKSSDKVEKETFTAMVILNQLYNALKASKINNIISLAINDHTFYLDEKGEKDDLDKAVFETETALDPLESQTFKNVFMVLEHDANNQKYLLEMKVEKEHKVGEYPIKVIINGLMTEFKAKPGETREELKRRIDALFSSQSKYDSYVESQRALFNNFIDDLALSVRKFIPSDDINITSNSKIIRPKEKVADKGHIKRTYSSGPVYHNYYGIDDYFFYSWLWSSSLYSHGIHVHNTDIVDPEGNDIMSVGDEGFNAGDTNTLNEDADFEPPNEGDIDYFGDNDYEAELSDANLFDDDSLTNVGFDSDTDSSWLSGGGSDFDFGDFGDFD